MGLKSILGKVGKVALKVAPYAAMAIPGVGVPLGMAIKGGIGAASGALGGGGLKGALIGGGLGAAGGALGGAGGALSKIGPSSSVLSKIGAGAAGKAVGTGIAGKAGAILGGMASNALGKPGPLIDASPSDPNNSWKGVVDTSVNQLGNMGRDAVANRMAGSRGKPSDALASGNAVPRQSGNAPGFQYDSNRPNLADSILAGRQNAVKNQPFRGGYDITQSIYNPTDPFNPANKHVISQMPKIKSDFDPRRRQAAY